MRTTTARLDLNVRQLAAAVLLIAAAGSVYAANEPVATSQAVQVDAQQAAKPLSKSQATRQQIMQKVANHEPLTYIETLYLR